MARLKKCIKYFGIMIPIIGVISLAALWYPIRKYMTLNPVELGHELLKTNYSYFWNINYPDIKFRFNAFSGINVMFTDQYDVYVAVEPGRDGTVIWAENTDHTPSFSIPISQEYQIIANLPEDNSIICIEKISDESQVFEYDVNDDSTNEELKAKTGLGMQELEDKLAFAERDYNEKLNTVASTVYSYFVQDKRQKTVKYMIVIVICEAIWGGWMYWTTKKRNSRR